MKQTFKSLGLTCKFKRLNKNNIKYGQVLTKILPFYFPMRYDEYGTILKSSLVNARTENIYSKNINYYYLIPDDEIVENI